MADETNAERRQPRAKRPPMPCRQCGRDYAPERQVERLRKKLGRKAPLIDVCPACRRKLHAKALVEAYEKTKATKQEAVDVS